MTQLNKIQLYAWKCRYKVQIAIDMSKPRLRGTLSEIRLAGLKDLSETIVKFNPQAIRTVVNLRLAS